MSNIINSVSYLRTSRDFPEDQQALRMELNKAYIDTANVVNSRTIGLFPTNKPAITGEQWFISGPSQKQQGLRQIYSVTGAGSIAHGIILSQISQFVRIWGTFTDGTNWYPLPYVDATAANNQVALKVTPTNIVITAGGGSPPTISSGVVILEWIANP